MWSAGDGPRTKLPPQLLGAIMMTQAGSIRRLNLGTNSTAFTGVASAALIRP